jgi:hypothetical protein
MEEGQIPAIRGRELLPCAEQKSKIFRNSATLVRATSWSGKLLASKDGVAELFSIFERLELFDREVVAFSGSRSSF